MTDRPWWQQLVLGVERRAAPVLRGVLHHEDVALAIAVGRTVIADLTGQVEPLSRRALHLLNLPAGSDVTRLLEQIASLERQVRELAKTVEDTRAGKEVPSRDHDHRLDVDQDPA